MELAPQQGAGIKRKAGRPVGSKTRNFLNVRGETQKVRRLAALRDAGTRARRSKPQTVSFDELVEPQPELSYGKQRAVTRHQVPAPQDKKQKKPFLSDKTKTNLKRAGALAATVGGAALAAALAAKCRRPREASEVPADIGDDWFNVAPTPPRRSPPRDHSTRVTPDAFRQFRDLLEAEQEVSRPGRFAGNRSITPERSPDRRSDTIRAKTEAKSLRSAERRQRLEDLRAEARRRDEEREGPILDLEGFDYSPEALGPPPQLRRSIRSTAGKRPKYPTGGGGRQSGSGLIQSLSPCDQMKDTCRTVMSSAERGDEKGARKEMKQLREHLRETKDCIMAL